MQAYLRHSYHEFDHKALQTRHHISNQELITEYRELTSFQLDVQKLGEVVDF